MPPRRKTVTGPRKSVPVPKTITLSDTPPPPQTTTAAAEPPPPPSPPIPDPPAGTLIEKTDNQPAEPIVEEAETQTLIEKSESGPAESNVEETEAPIEKSDSGPGTRKRKTTRVVKKVIKKKVLKKIPKGSLDGGVSVENPNPNESVSSEIEGSGDNNNNPVSMEVENPGPSVSESVSSRVVAHSVENVVAVEVEKVGSGSLGIAGTNNRDIPVSVEVESSEPVDSVSVEVEDPNKEKESGDGCLVENISGDDLGSAQGEKVVSLTEVVPGKKSEGSTDQKDEQIIRDESLEKCGGEEGVNKAEGEHDSGDAILDAQTSNEAPKTENLNDSSIEGEQSDDHGVGTSNGLAGFVMSAELEALERQRKRRTEIFIGGLDKEAKEEDIRKVFEEVGEVKEVTLVKDVKTGKSKGFAFIRYASAADAKTALAKFNKVEICGKQCRPQPVEGNDTIFIGNIEKKWKNEDVLKHLQEAGVEKIDTVTVVADPKNIKLNRGFGFIEFETIKDAQTAYKKLKKKDVFGKHLKINVEWAEPLTGPDEEEMLKVKSVYAEHIPSSWDEEKVKDHFKRFGEIENVTLARDLRSSKRLDFAFVNYSSREAALDCIKALNNEQLTDEGSKVNLKVSLAKSTPKGKPNKPVSKLSSEEISKEKRMPNKAVMKPHEIKNLGKSINRSYKDARVDKKSSTSAELVHLLREQASWRQSGPAVSSIHPSPGQKRPFAALGGDPYLSDPRRYPQARLESHYDITDPRSRVGGVTFLPDYYQQRQEPLYRIGDPPSFVQTRQPAPYHGSSGLYRRY